MVMDTAPETKIRAIERLGASIVRATYDECWRTVESHGSTAMTRPLRPPVRRRPVHRRQRTAGLEILEDLPDVDAIVAPLGGGGLLAGIAAAVARAEARTRASTPRSRKRRRRSRRRSRPGEPVYFDGWTGVVRRRRRRQVGAADDVAAAVDSSSGSIVVSLDDVARAMRWRPSARTSSPKAPPAARSPPRSAAAPARGKVVAVVSGGNIDLARFAALVGACANRYRTMTTDTPRCPPLPERIAPPRRARRRSLVELASPKRASVFRRLDYPLWRATAHNPVRMLWLIPRGQARGRGRRSRRSCALYDAAIAALDDGARGAQHLVGAARSRTSTASRSPTSPPSSRCTSRCRSTPAASACWPAITARKPSDLGVPLIGVGFMYPQGYFHQHMSAEGWQEESYERLNWADAPIEPALTPDGKPCVTAVPLGDRIGARRRLARAPRPRQAVPARHRSRGERAVGSRAVGAPLRRRSRDAHPAGNHPRHRRRPRAARRSASSPAVFHLNEGHAGVRRAAAHPRAHRARAPASTTRSRRSAGRRSSRRTRRCRPGTTRSRSTSSRSISPAAGARSAPNRDRFLALGVVRQRRRPAVQHDRAGAALGRRRQRASASCTAR